MINMKRYTALISASLVQTAALLLIISIIIPLLKANGKTRFQ